MLKLVAVAGSDRGVAADAVAGGVDRELALVVHLARSLENGRELPRVGCRFNSQLQCPFSFYPLSLLYLAPPLPPVPAVSGEPPPSGFGAAFIGAPGKTHIPQQQIWSKLAAEEYERFRAL